MTLVYYLFIRLYVIAIKIVAAFGHEKAKKSVEGRKSWKQKISEQITPGSKYLWIHASSLGEFEQARPLIDIISKQKSEYKILLSFFSPSGYQIQKKYQKADIVCYLPFDIRGNAKHFINIVKPELVVFVKYDFWYGYIKNTIDNKIPIVLISAIFRKKQIFFKWYGKFFLRMLKMFDVIFLQDNKSKKILGKCGIVNTKVCGDSRIDRVYEIANTKFENKILESFSSEKPVIVAGSTYEKDEKIIVKYIKENPKYKLIIAPHDVSNENVDRIINLCGKNNAVKFSEAGVIDKSVSVIVIDFVGILSKLYRYAQFAYIGGGFGKSIHNILEPAIYGIPVLFGHKHSKFKEAEDLLYINVAYEINNQSDFNKYANMFYNNEQALDLIKQSAHDYFSQSLGASDLIFNYLTENDFL